MYIKGTFDNANCGVLVRAMESIDFLLMARSWAFRFVDALKANLVVDGNLSVLRKAEMGMLQGSLIWPLLFLICTRNLYRRIRDMVAGFVDDIIIHIRSGMLTKQLSSSQVQSTYTMRGQTAQPLSSSAVKIWAPCISIRAFIVSGRWQSKKENLLSQKRASWGSHSIIPKTIWSNV